MLLSLRSLHTDYARPLFSNEKTDTGTRIKEERNRVRNRPLGVDIVEVESMTHGTPKGHRTDPRGVEYALYPCSWNINRKTAGGRRSIRLASKIRRQRDRRICREALR